MVGWLEEFVCCSPRVIASGKDPTRTLKGPSRGPDDHSIMRHRRAVSAGARRIRLPVCSLFEKHQLLNQNTFSLTGSFHFPQANTVEALISINNQLQQPEAAVGILTYAQQHLSLELKESWYEKLQRWDEALEAYQRKRATTESGNSSAVKLVLGEMRCLHALAEWDHLSRLCREFWPLVDAAARTSMAPLATQVTVVESSCDMACKGSRETERRNLPLRPPFRPSP
eukprot:1194677-Prorocentrum_minimum.AAC.6